MAARLWIDVEDLFAYMALGRSRPSGIQRLAYELCRALHEQGLTLQAQDRSSGGVGLLRHDDGGAVFRSVGFEELEALFARCRDAPLAPMDEKQVSSPPWRRLPGPVRRVVDGLPEEIGRPLVEVVKGQIWAVAAFVRLAINLSRLPMRLRRSRQAAAAAEEAARSGEGGAAADFVAEVQEGDFLLSLGAGWMQAGYTARIGQAVALYRLRYAMLLCDIVPLRRPEWCDRTVVVAFRDWFHGILPMVDLLLTISDATGAEVRSYAAAQRLPLPAMRTIPMGTGFAPGGCAMEGVAGEGSPLAGEYVLFVSTIEARKNHALLFRVWRRLLETMPAAEVPVLVFAGRVGWLVADLMQQLVNADYLDGKIVVVENPADQALASLYRGCLFTVFPSLYEGWGLPVSESLAFGKPCVVAKTTSLPEAGGRLARYFDPESLEDATRVIRRAIEDRAGLAVWEAQVRREFRPVGWEVSAGVVLESMFGPVAVETAAE